LPSWRLHCKPNCLCGVFFVVWGGDHGVKKIHFNEQYCPDLKANLKSIIFDLNKKAKWKLAKIYKKKDINNDIPCIKTKSTSEGKYFKVPAEVKFSLEITIPDLKSYEEKNKTNYHEVYQETIDKEVKYENNQHEITPNYDDAHEPYLELDDSTYTSFDDNFQENNSKDNNFQIKRKDSSITGLLIIFMILITIVLSIHKRNKIKKQELEKKKKLEAEQKKKQEVEAKRKVELEKKKKLEAEEKRKAELEKKKKLEAEAKRKAELEKKKKLEAEAKRKAELEKKKKLEAEAKRKAELEKKKKLEAEAKRKAELEKKEEQLRIEKNSYYYEIEINNRKVIKGPFSREDMISLLEKNEISLLTNVKFGLHKKTFKKLKSFPEFTSGFEDFL